MPYSGTERPQIYFGLLVSSLVEAKKKNNGNNNNKNEDNNNDNKNNNVNGLICGGEIIERERKNVREGLSSGLEEIPGQSNVFFYLLCHFIHTIIVRCWRL